LLQIGNDTGSFLHGDQKKRTNEMLVQELVVTLDKISSNVAVLELKMIIIKDDLNPIHYSMSKLSLIS
jgi:hypothetical protein